MKRTTLSVFILLNAICGWAQTVGMEDNAAIDTLCMSKFTAVYNYSIRTLDHNGKEVLDTILLAVQVGDGYWKCTPYQRVENIRNSKTKYANDAYDQEALMHIETIVNGYPEGMLTVHEAIAPYCYEIVEDKEAIKWTMNDEEEKICDYECKGASCTFRGKKWNVMYAEDIPTTAGPWKLSGLPGLITSATDAEGIHSFTLVGLYNEALPITHEKYYVLYKFDPGSKKFGQTAIHYEKRTHKQMVALKKKTLGSRIYASNPQFFVPDLKAFGQIEYRYTSTDRTKQINGTTVLDKAHKFQPLELK